jgi:hypothetical protein
VWSGYQLQFSGQRPHAWQEDLAADLRRALAALDIQATETLAGQYATTDPGSFDVENRLFTNPGNSIPGHLQGLSFERRPQLPPSPAPINTVGGHLHYYRYQPADHWSWWAPDQLLATWSRVPRQVSDDGTSGRPAWLAMRAAAEAGRVTVLGSLPGGDAPFGLRLVMHATRTGRRSAAAISERLVDGVVAAFHAREPRPEAAASFAATLTAKAPAILAAEVIRLVMSDGPGPMFMTSPLGWNGRTTRLNPADERCHAGSVTVRRDARGPVAEISGELLTLKPTG